MSLVFYDKSTEARCIFPECRVFIFPATKIYIHCCYIHSVNFRYVHFNNSAIWKENWTEKSADVECSLQKLFKLELMNELLWEIFKFSLLNSVFFFFFFYFSFYFVDGSEALSWNCFYDKMLFYLHLSVTKCIQSVTVHFPKKNNRMKQCWGRKKIAFL